MALTSSRIDRQLRRLSQRVPYDIVRLVEPKTLAVQPLEPHELQAQAAGTREFVSPVKVPRGGRESIEKAKTVRAGVATRIGTVDHRAQVVAAVV